MTLSSDFIKAQALEVGFDICGIAPAGVMPQMLDRFTAWLGCGYHAQMHYMEEHLEMRCNPQLLVEGAQSVICMAVGYKPDRMIQSSVKIAQYAYGEDYHTRIKSMLFALIDRIREQYPNFEAKPCVDTVPISDKLWAAQSGIGWIGRNTLLVTRQCGSYVNLAELVTTMECDRYDSPIENLCGECRKCVTACPNHAIADGVLDANRCNAYNTIENRSESLPESINLCGYAFGCDCCQLVCPYNAAAESRVHVSDELFAELESLPDADVATFKRAAKHRALNRVKYAQWQRNIKKIRVDGATHSKVNSLSDDRQTNK